MIIIADSGSTKTDWRFLLPDGRQEQAKTAGFNPMFQETEQILLEMSNHLLPQIQGFGTAKEIHFYGAGCSTPERSERVHNALRTLFTEASIEVKHDLLAAARGLCGHEPGIACILGTGANSCLYDGKEIIDHPISLGFWLGDEGSGGYIGKQLVKDFLNGDLPEHLADKFAKRYKLEKNEIIDKIYREPFPNRFLASFSKFLFDNRKDPFCYALVQQSFRDFFERFVLRYPNYDKLPVHILGSVAFYFSDILRRVAKEKNVNLQRISDTPIAGLVLYHQENSGSIK